MAEAIVPLVAVLAIFIGMPWLFLHYRMKSKQNRSLSIEDERMLDELHQAALRLEDRLQTIERIMSVDNPGWRQIAAGSPIGERPEDTRTADIRRLK
ncbi:envelope stress response membrane protein PspB [Sphingosinicella microcystinivorans]|uniref:envelope stress response membrane protein PspB n=1 Tax=Sphingosinicella microcystinivorans TaxID=335406 RepID=UPI0022F3A1DC|nr:envelope stress response membrane protein PspB [Sphingosinicella microcystinivorans]WBX85062.1 envelope stress response membrane protein PspB [Sphingosinicella microcystinivorans]